MQFKNKAILLVEDDMILAMQEQLSLEEYGYRVSVARSGEEAVAAIGRMSIGQEAGPDLILMDIDLGEGMDGTEAAARILGNRDIPILFLSSHTEPEIVSKTEAISSFGYVVKNSGITVLDASIKMAFKLFDAKQGERREREALRDSEEKYRETLAQSLDGIATADRSGAVLTWNASMASISGVAAEEALGLPIWDLQWSLTPEHLRKPELRERMRSFVEDSLEGKARTRRGVKGLIQARDGRTRAIETSNFIIDTSGGRMFCAIFHETTELIEAESILAETRLLLETIVDSTDDMIWSIRVDGDKYRWMSFNHRVAEYFSSRHGARIEVGMSSELLFRDPGEAAFWSEQYRKTLEKGSHSVQYRSADGRVIYNFTFNVLRDRGGVFGISVFGKDISEQTLRYEELLGQKVLLKDLFDHAPAGIVYSTLDGKIVSANTRYATMLGFDSPEEAKETINKSGLARAIYAEPEDRSRLVEEVTSAGGDWIQLEQHCRRRDGRLITTLTTLRVSPLDPSMLESFSEDITERREAEQRLRLSEARYRGYIDKASDAIFVLDARGALLEANAAAVALTGYSAEELHGMTILDFAVRSRPNAEALLREVLSAGVAETEKEFRHRDGSTRWCSINAKLIDESTILAIVADVSQRKLASEARRESEERLSLVLGASGLGFWDWDLGTQRVVRDRHWAEMLGYDPGELAPTIDQWRKLCHPEDRDQALERLQAHIEGREDFYRAEYRLRTADGGYTWIQDSGKIVRRDGEGRPERICGTHRDISREREKTERIEKLLEERGLILREVHHRIRNNMNTMKSLVYIQRKSASSEAAVRILQDVENRFSSMMVLYDRLYRTESYQRLSVQNYLPSLAAEIISNFPNAGSVSVSYDIADFILEAKTLQTLGIIVNELLTNIMKYAFAEGSRGEIRVGARREGGHVELRIEDNGVGMPASVTFSDSGGFGLMLIERLTKQMAGSIRIERGRGTRIVLEFDAP